MFPQTIDLKSSVGSAGAAGTITNAAGKSYTLNQSSGRAPYRYIFGFIKTNQNGTFSVQASHDGSTFYEVDTLSTSANTGYSLEFAVCAPYMKFTFTPSADTNSSAIFNLYGREDFA